MKRFLFVIFTVSLLLLPISIYASETHEQIEGEIKDELSSFHSSLPEYVIEFLPNDISNGDFSLQSSNLLDEKKIFDYILDYIFFGLEKTVKSFVAVLILIIIASIFITFS